MNFVKHRLLSLRAVPLCQIRRCSASSRAENAPSASPVKAAISRATNDFADQEGRRPRVLLVSMQAQRHTARSGDSLASSLAQLGFDVDVCPIIAPAAIAREAVEADVHLVHLHVAEEGPVRESIADVAGAIVEDLKREGATDIPVCVLLPAVEEQERARLVTCGVSSVFTPETSETDMCDQYLRLLMN
ncbi:hypothetical protein STCU_10634 [Strigomonas culicis]|uniref:Response regulatory domain-containing protein n=1 Tax=Strigomonas culicis TaxID=28005 RepID=S9TKR9_9TRYP|nr:hypothetical protein STCU_10634 [Strigomonas culicis]|eukprot:EPY17409.1 hypothetical protein STCU_10634 [Strigomonas culicis]